MEILGYIVVAIVMGVISYLIWDRDDNGVIKDSGKSGDRRIYQALRDIEKEKKIKL